MEKVIEEIKRLASNCDWSLIDDKVYITDPHPSMKAPNIVSLVQFKEMTENLETTIQNIQ